MSNGATRRGRPVSLSLDAQPERWGSSHPRIAERTVSRSSLSRSQGCFALRDARCVDHDDPGLPALIATAEQVLDAAADVLIRWIPGGVPKRAGAEVVVRDERGDATSAFALQVRLPGVDKLPSNSHTPMTGMHCEPVQIAPPSVPCGDHNADDLALCSAT
jgi:hypothetical protein